MMSNLTIWLLPPGRGEEGRREEWRGYGEGGEREMCERRKREKDKGRR